MLLDGRDSLADIALQNGFADQSHFTKTFCRKTGMTPATWKRIRRNRCQRPVNCSYCVICSESAFSYCFLESRFVLQHSYMCYHTHFLSAYGMQAIRKRRIEMKIVLYGATGNSGQRILQELTKRGHEVTAVARSTSKLPPTVKAVSDDLSNVDAIASVIAGADVVVSALTGTVMY